MLKSGKMVGPLLALGLIVLSCVEAAGSGIKTMQLSMLPYDQVAIDLVPGAPRALLSIAQHVGDGAPYQSALVTNVWGAQNGELCYLTYLAGEHVIVPQGTQVIATVPHSQSKSNDTLMESHGWMPPTISSSMRKKFLLTEGCMDIDWRWKDIHKESSVHIAFRTGVARHGEIIVWHSNGSASPKAFGKFTSFPGMMTIASGEPGVDIKRVAILRAGGGRVTVPKEYNNELSVATHTMLMLKHGTQMKVQFVPKISNATLTFSLHNPQVPQQAVIFNIVGLKNGKFCVVSMRSQPANSDLVDYSRATYAPWDVAPSKPLKKFRSIGHIARSVHGCPGWFGNTRVTGLLDTCKDDKGEMKWDPLPPNVELVLRSEANGFRLLLDKHVMPGEFSDGWIPSAAGKDYKFCVGPSPGMSVIDITTGED